MAEKMGNGSSVWEQTYKEIECKHNLAFRTIEEAITLEEREKPSEVTNCHCTKTNLIVLT